MSNSDLTDSDDDDAATSSDERHRLVGEYVGERNAQGERDGFGQALLPNGDRYRGSYKANRRDGYGLYLFAQARYDGEYVEGVRDGRGLCCYPDASVYAGEWRRQKRHGFGSYEYSGGNSNERYEGFWRDGVKEGDGVYYAGQSKYVGGFKAGLRDGDGQVTTPEWRFEGRFRNDWVSYVTLSRHGKDSSL